MNYNEVNKDYVYVAYNFYSSREKLALPKLKKGMRKLLKSFKTEINPTEEQKIKKRKTIGTCRYIYNFYLTHNKELYDNGKKFMSGKSFSVWLNNEYLPNHPEYSWVKEVSSKSCKSSTPAFD